MALWSSEENSDDFDKPMRCLLGHNEGYRSNLKYINALTFLKEFTNIKLQLVKYDTFYARAMYMNDCSIGLRNEQNDFEQEPRNQRDYHPNRLSHQVAFPAIGPTL